MFRLQKKFRFEASHQLKHHDGKCARLHGHSWNGFIEVEGNYLIDEGPKQNMLIDYADLSKITKEIEQRFDHQHLNDVLGEDMPTSELIARKIFSEFADDMPKGLSLRRVVIEETCTSRCEFSEDEDWYLNKTPGHENV